jgi:hypothetical protein
LGGPAERPGEFAGTGGESLDANEVFGCVRSGAGDGVGDEGEGVCCEIVPESAGFGGNGMGSGRHCWKFG